ncbi:MAG: OmpA family protein [Bacteroidetes bacterium]|jgi:OmpA-OmpF porin, OOP family|nr:OmpA family protein [Bacteroidota bacterium]MBT6684869.1 OmpA family protein [Bacteroidota bacterium]MBT7142563.1 OmpA family protein [Bacteroidota bacterium]MBT7493260.1 OmpA family protein [Bacteroidota bacterium]
MASFYYRITTIIVVLTLLFSQYSLSKEKPRKLKRKARRAYIKQDYYKAKELYEKYIELKPEKYDKIYILAELQRLTRDYKKARENYAKLAAKKNIDYPLASYFAAISFQMTAEYAIADSFYNVFLNSRSKNIYDRKYRKLSEIGLQSCAISDSLINSPVEVAIIHLDTSINKAYSEFSPIPVNENTFWFASLQSDTLLPSGTAKRKQFYKAEKISNLWKNAGLLEEKFNDLSFSNGNGCFSPYGDRFYLARCEKNLNDIKICNIYVSEYEKNEWQKPKILPAHVNHLDFNSTQPTIGRYSKHKDKEILYFVSNRPGGRGGFDIWYTIFNKRKKTYTEARNLGSDINSIGDELAPFYDIRTGAMYFSSDGYPGLGGLDIYKSYGEKKNWTKPAQIGYPLNSSYDDLYFTTMNKEYGFFVSNRDGGVSFRNQNCCDDIYSFRYTAFIHFAIKGSVYELIDDTTKRSLENTLISIYMIDRETEEEILILENECDENGDYLIDVDVGYKYKIIASKEDYFSKSKKINTENIDYSDTLINDLILQKIPKKPIKLENIYFDFDSAELLAKAKSSIDTTLLVIMNDNPEMNIKIEAHTDSKGNDAFNMDLSKRRAKSITDYLLKKGINKNRLISEGFGETQPIAPNKNPDGSDKPEGRQLNRRIEFRVIN